MRTDQVQALLVGPRFNGLLGAWIASEILVCKKTKKLFHVHFIAELVMCVRIHINKHTRIRRAFPGPPSILLGILLLSGAGASYSGSNVNTPFVHIDNTRWFRRDAVMITFKDEDTTTPLV